MRDETTDAGGRRTDGRTRATPGGDDGAPQSRRAVLGATAAASTALYVGLSGMVRNATARQTDDTGESPSASITMRDQRTDGNIVVVESVRLPEGGYVGIHSEQLFDGETDTSMIGTSGYLDAGEHDAVAVDLFDLEGIHFEVGELYEDELLLAAPHRETTGDAVNEFAATGGEVDVPYAEAGEPIVDIGHATVDPDESVATVSFRNQRTDGGAGTVDTVTLTDGGFVALHDATTFQDDLAASVVGASDYLGYGIHDDVDVRLFASAIAESADGSGLPLVAVPHLDTNGNEAFDFVESVGEADRPYRNDGRPVADFGFVAPA